ncbi:XdhC family protein [Paralimibaculum aggregatum]|uniref:XdhC family protein n=1 Tax=Paralimibaculum aggregatum TaxID=3036245 RepID=A0ABQ6LS12_9RHOB|nr:XdhC/CoxI family protein [Limibaculum sp. NKW23]GMG84863.1 XdhC family protein [Limibaculum sp. NKW23]
MHRAAHDMIPETALDWHRQGRQAAIATVVETWGSAPRPVGAQLAISGEAELAGSVSGGCVEGAVAAEALEALSDGTARLMEFGVSDGDAFAVGLACGGTIRVLVEPVGAALPEALLAELVAARAARRAVGVETRLAADPAGPVTPMPGLAHRLIGYADAPARFDADRSGFDAEAPRRFIAIHNPPLRLAIIGGAHIAQPLALMARETGYDVTVIDPREAFASPARFPGERLMHDWPDAALKAHGLDLRCAVVLLTHDPKLDDPALMVALPSPAFYIGALGSTRTHARRRERLAAAGLAPELIDRIDAPVGLDIGARSPAEIAVATLAQMTERLRRPETRPGRTPVPGAPVPA